MERNEKESGATETRERKLCNQIRKRAKEKKTKEYEKEQKIRKHKQSNVEFDNEKRESKVYGKYSGNIKREKREIGKRKRAGSSAIRKSVQEQEFRMAEGILMVAESKT